MRVHPHVNCFGTAHRHLTIACLLGPPPFR
jgi:hypothetical protein